MDAADGERAPLLLHSLATIREVILPALDTAGARRVVEIGGEDGGFTTHLAERAAANDGHVDIVDPAPSPELERMVAAAPALDLVREASPAALHTIAARGRGSRHVRDRRGSQLRDRQWRARRGGRARPAPATRSSSSTTSGGPGRVATSTTAPTRCRRGRCTRTRTKAVFAPASGTSGRVASRARESSRTRSRRAAHGTGCSRPSRTSSPVIRRSSSCRCRASSGWGSCSTVTPLRG